MTTRHATGFLPRSSAEALAARLSDRMTVMAFALIQWPWLLRSLRGGSKASKRVLMERLDLPADALPSLGSWKADTALLHRIVDVIERDRPAVVMELGAGATSLVAAAALRRNGGGRLVSVDQHADFVDATRDWLADYGLSADMSHAPLAPAPAGWFAQWYAPRTLPDAIDLLVIDGPPWTLHPMVRGAAETLFSRIRVGGTVLLDDAARPGERMIATRWRQAWPNFEFTLMPDGTKGTLVGTRRS